MNTFVDMLRAPDEKRLVAGKKYKDELRFRINSKSLPEILTIKIWFTSVRYVTRHLWHPVTTARKITKA